MVDEFTGFPAEGLAFLTKLGARDKAWFDANRATYEAQVVGPAKSFVSAMGEALADGFAPNIIAEPKTNGSIAPINNDLRFSPDKPPYKDHLLLKWWEGDDKKRSPTLWVRITQDQIGFATGAPIHDVERWRSLVADDAIGADLANALTALAKGRSLDIDGQGYKKVPKPYDENHPRADLLRHKMGLQARWSEPIPAGANKRAFVDWCTRRLEAAAPVHHWFVEHLV
ncbi:MAG: DUF2461 family protein [Actinomycetota bacterium]